MVQTMKLTSHLVFVVLVKETLKKNKSSSNFKYEPFVRSEKEAVINIQLTVSHDMLRIN